MTPNLPKPNRSPGLVLAVSLVAFAAGVIAVALVLFLTNAVTGFADGDPPSDYLLNNQVYLPITPPSAESGDRLKALVAAANDDGYAIRVAVIQAPQDLGSIPQLLGKPQTYASFLGSEIAFAYRGHLLTVMQNGYGISQNGGKPVPGGYATLSTVPKPAGGSSDQLTDAASLAVRKLSAAAGHPLPANPAGLSSSTAWYSTPAAIGGGVVLLIALLGGGAWLVLRRRGNSADRAV